MKLSHIHAYGYLFVDDEPTMIIMKLKPNEKKMLQMNSSYLMAKLEYIEIQEVYCACVYVMCEDKENV